MYKIYTVTNKQSGTGYYYTPHVVNGEVYKTDDVDNLAKEVKSLLENTLPRTKFEVVKCIDVEIDVILKLYGHGGTIPPEAKALFDASGAALFDVDDKRLYTLDQGAENGGQK